MDGRPDGWTPSAHSFSGKTSTPGWIRSFSSLLVMLLLLRICFTIGKKSKDLISKRNFPDRQNERFPGISIRKESRSKDKIYRQAAIGRESIQAPNIAVVVAHMDGMDE